MNTLELNSVRKSYDKFVAVDDLSFNIASGTMFGLLGPNGAGKTSTIRMMMGITYPDSGSVQMFGEPFRRELLERVGYLPEERGLYAKMKVQDQLIFLGQTHGLSASEAKKRSLAWGERLEIAGSFQKKTNELSKGMQQKIQFITTLMHDPEFIIMDEPFAGLDPVNSKLLEDVLLDLNRQGRTVLFSSHRMDQVEKLCDSICLVNRGEAVLQGDLKAVKSRYGKNTVQMAFEEKGDFDPGFLKNNAMVQKLDHYEGHIQLVLVPGSDPQPLLREMVGKSRLSRFEVMEPSLEEIFIDVVGKTNV
ncbi:MAG TPA: ATP-binding cassette domain-containing protein [Terriglobales bacterium]|nr:ATP-binding cassette domain-containing protein [Terriglobales bacterium]